MPNCDDWKTMPIELVNLPRLVTYLKFDDPKSIRKMYKVDLSTLDPQFEAKLNQASARISTLVQMWQNKKNEVTEVEKAAIVRRCGCFTRVPDLAPA
ncbi:MAG: hypothetical protein JWL80_199 [Parcubacteria group bacterium]|nr:hypothetical protein [Parcubacteria group bacterium]